MPVILTEKAFESLCAIVDPQLLVDPRFNHRVPRARHMTEFRDAIEAWTSQRSARTCQDTMMNAGVPCARYATLEDVLDDPQLAGRGSFATLNDGTSTFKVNNAPFRFRNSDTSIRSGAPKLGEQTATVLYELLGLDASDFSALVKEGIVS